MQLYQDEFSVITYDAGSGILILTWTAKTANMTDDDFKTVNLAYADQSIEQQARKLLVDVRRFGHHFGEGLGQWRLQQIIPKYHQAGVEKFAFLHGPDFEAPPNGRKEEGENFISRHFASEERARAWLVDGS